MSDQSDLKDQILGKLEKVIDPELGCDIVNLGLIYGLSFDNGTVTVTMTLTTMGCPIMEVLEKMVERSLLELSEVKEVNINLVWEPVWTVDKMSRFAKLALGIH